MKDIIALSFVVGSLTGMGFIVLRKIPELKKIEASSVSIFSFTRKLWGSFKGKLKNWHEKISELFSWNTILQKILSQIRVTALRVERKTGQWLSRARERTRNKKEREAYWEKLSGLAAEDSFEEKKPR